MGESFPELKKNHTKIKEIISEEETSFSRTLVKVITHRMLLDSMSRAIAGSAWHLITKKINRSIMTPDQGIERFKKAAAEVKDGVLGAQVCLGSLIFETVEVWCTFTIGAVRTALL